MGKTTVLRLVAGRLASARGRIRVLGVDPRNFKVERLARLGLGIVNERRDVFASLTVADNLRISSHQHSGAPQLQQWLLDELAPSLKARMSIPAGGLSGGERSLLAYLNALSRSPRLLLVDELSEGLQPAAVSRLTSVLKHFVNKGTSILFVEQSHSVLRDFSDREFLLQNGILIEQHSTHLRAESVELEGQIKHD